MQIAPIALFVYNRPQHVRYCIESLQKNFFADKSELFILTGQRIAVRKKMCGRYGSIYVIYRGLNDYIS